MPSYLTHVTRAVDTHRKGLAFAKSKAFFWRYQALQAGLCIMEKTAPVRSLCLRPQA